VLFHFVGVFGDDHFIGAEPHGVVLFTGRGGKDHGVGSETVRKLYGHVTEPAETNDANFFAFRDAPVAHRRVRGDSGAEQGSGAGQVKIFGNAKDEAITDHDAIGIPAIGDATEMLIGSVVGVGCVDTELLEACFALGTGAIGIDQAANSGEVARSEFFYRGADLSDAADDFVPGNARISGGHEGFPLVANGMQVGVTYTAKENFDLYVVIGCIPSRDGGLFHW